MLLLGAVLLPVSAYASTDDFYFKSFDADYYLGSDSSGRSTLKTVETLVAVFPETNQNHGVERAIPKTYDNHPTSLKIESVRDRAGKKLNYTTRESGGNLVLRIGDADRYVHGENAYVITYTQRDVTKLLKDTNSVEFYWDTNGTQWRQAFGTVSARVHLSDAIRPTFTDKVACYKGVEGSTDRCPITVEGSLITATAAGLGAGENMTVAVGFTNGTFRGYEPSIWDIIVGLWVVSLVATSIAGFIAIFWLSFRYYRISNRNRELNPVTTEYIPPKDTSVLVSAQIGDGTKAETTAQIIDLAVRHYITITQTSEKSLFKQAEYVLEIIKSTGDLTNEEQEFVATLFGSKGIGTRLETKTLKSNYGLFSKLQANGRELTKRIKGEYELRIKDDKASGSFKKIGIVMIIASIVLVSPMLLISGLVALGCAWTLRPLSDKGLALRRYMAGLKVYIELAEKERLKILQSPEAAEKTGVTLKNGREAKLVKLYERILPYAILFGQEKEWNKQLAIYYESTGDIPSWYVGHSAFNAAVFTSAMNDFSGSMNSYGASTSSSSGGSSGGGSSGGGGGGGGGGGW